MTLDDFRLWVPIFISSAGLLWSILLYRLSARKAEAEALKDRLTASENRVTVLEGRIEQLPNQEAVHRLQLSIAGVQGDVKVMAEGFKAVQQSSKRIEDFLMHTRIGGQK